MSVRSLAIVATRYPCNRHPTWHVFVRQIAHSFARQGVEVSVISPISLHRAWLGGDACHTIEDAGDGATVSVFRPRFVSMSCFGLGRWNSFRLTVKGIQRAVKRVLCKQMTRRPDALYGHFMYPAGAVAVSLGTELSIPAFPAAGEISLDTVEHIGRGEAGCELSKASAFIANSTHLARLMEQRLKLGRERIAVFPNGINRRIFFPRERAVMRRQYGLPEDQLLIAFTGSFEPRKGARRVAEAIRGIDGVSGVFIGAGDEPPEGKNIVFCQRVPHQQVPELLSACDVFVLPTTDEGCCNAIVEAMACGLPVISSTGSFNDEILNEDVSIRIDSLDVDALRLAISRLKNDAVLRQRMASAALQWSAHFDIDERARKILSFMESEIRQRQAAACK
jgi:teichuronic acid biosynthesis glycosyltransferase TuaC